MTDQRKLRRPIDTTTAIRRHILDNPHLESSRTACLGCGAKVHPDTAGTSRWNPKAHLCTDCCIFEALSGRLDPFGLSALPGGRDCGKGAIA